MKLIARTAETTLRKLARSYPAVIVTGPRQSGKTTLTQVVFPDKPYVSLGLALPAQATLIDRILPRHPAIRA